MHACCQMTAFDNKSIDNDFFVIPVSNRVQWIPHVGQPPVKEGIIHTRMSAQALKIGE